MNTMSTFSSNKLNVNSSLNIFFYQKHKNEKKLMFSSCNKINFSPIDFFSPSNNEDDKLLPSTQTSYPYENYDCNHEFIANNKQTRSGDEEATCYFICKHCNVIKS